MKRQPTEWQKMFAKDAIDKRLISKVYKQLIEINIKKKLNKKMGGDLHRHFSKEGNRCRERYSMSLIIRKR